MNEDVEWIRLKEGEPELLRTFSARTAVGSRAEELVACAGRVVTDNKVCTRQDTQKEGDKTIKG